MAEEPEQRQDQMWKYKDLVDKFSTKPADAAGSEEAKTIVGLKVVQGRAENPYLPIAPEPEAEKKPAPGSDGRFDYMPP